MIRFRVRSAGILPRTLPEFRAGGHWLIECEGEPGANRRRFTSTTAAQCPPLMRRAGSELLAQLLALVQVADQGIRQKDSVSPSLAHWSWSWHRDM